MRSHRLRQTLNSITGVLTKREEDTEIQRRHTGEEGHVKTDAEFHMVLLQSKECQEILGATRSYEEAREDLCLPWQLVPTYTLISDFQPPEL